MFEKVSVNKRTTQTGKVYTGPAWSMNVVYARLKPSGAIKTLLLNSILGAFRLSAWLFYKFSLLILKRKTPSSSNQRKAPPDIRHESFRLS
jgi:hypothetical protein